MRVQGTISQGDIFHDFPVPVLRERTTYPFFEAGFDKKSVIVMTQACDIEQSKVTNISFCEIQSSKDVAMDSIKQSKIANYLGQKKSSLKSIKDKGSTLALVSELEKLGINLDEELKKINEYEDLLDYVINLEDKFPQELNEKLKSFRGELIKDYSGLSYDLTEKKNLDAAKAFLEKVRKGELTNLHLLNEFTSDSGEFLHSHIVLLKDTYSVPVTSVLTLIETEYSEGHFRLLPPYREHLAQAYSNTFNRIGLPQDIKIDQLDLVRRD